MSASDDQTKSPMLLEGRRVVFLGKLAGMAKRDAAALVRSHGATVVERPDPSVHLAVVGEETLPLPDAEGLDEWFDAETHRAVDDGTLKVITETELWQRLELVDAEHDLQRLYTPAMLAQLFDVPVAIIRRWHRRGLIVPVREVRRLPYFDFKEVATARRLAELLAAGVSPGAIEKKLETLARDVPGVARPLSQLSVIIQGKEILLRQGDGLIEPGGQLRFDFEAPPRRDTADEVAPSEQVAIPIPEAGPVPASPEDMCRAAVELEEDGQVSAAAEMLRAAMAAGGPNAETCFQLAELLYRQGDLAGARERYYMAVELDEDYVEARANLGCVLAESGQHDLAIAAFEGTLAFHADYADVHYHLARSLDETGRQDEARRHWQTFLELAPNNPWAEEARARLR